MTTKMKFLLLKGPKDGLFKMIALSEIKSICLENRDTNPENLEKHLWIRQEDRLPMCSVVDEFDFCSFVSFIDGNERNVFTINTRILEI